MNEPVPSSSPPAIDPGRGEQAAHTTDTRAARFAFPELGAAAQAAVPGFYAWGVTIMPAAWSRGAPVIAKISAIGGLLAVLGFVFAEPRIGWRARVGGVWSLLFSGVFTWAAAPSALSPFHLDFVHGIAGMFGWGLFAFASAGPAIRPGTTQGERFGGAAMPKARLRLRRGDHLYIAGALLAAVVLQTVGWSVTVPERALFVRLVALMCGIALLGAAAELSTSRYARRKRQTSAARLRRALPLLLSLAIVAVLGFALALTIVPALIPW